MALIILLWIAGLAGAFAQSQVTVIGPVTPGDCTAFNSQTVIKDAGTTCGGGGSGVPGGVNGSIQYNNSSSFGGFVASGDATINTATGQVTVTKTNGVAFAPSATTDTTNASNVTSGSLANARLTPGAANTVKGSLNGTATTDIAIASCSAIYNFTQWVTGTGWQCGINPVLPSRSTAAGLNLSAFSSITTQGYAAAGDGGGATFKNVSSTAFLDSFITTFTITGGSGYTNGSYFGVVWVKGTKPFAIGTATVSGNAVTAASVAGTPGGSCSVGDVYTTSSIAGGTGAQLTVTGCSTPLGSFTDSVGTHFQIVYDGTSPNVRQFGAVGNWAGTDGSATDNFNAIQAALWFVSYMNQLNAGGGGYWGGRLWVPQGSFLVCGAGSTSLIVPNGVTLEAASSQGSVLKMCDSFSASTPFMTLCDTNWHFACFDSVLSNIQLMATRSAAVSGNIPMVYSRGTQDFGGLYHVYIYGGLRTCVFFEHGDGGASTVSIEHLSCTTDSAAPQVQIGDTSGSGLNYGTTMINISDVILGGSSSGGTYQSTSGLLVLGGFVNITRLHCESMPVCIEINNTGSIGAGQVWINNANGGSSAPAPTFTGVIQLDSTNTQLNTAVSMVQAPGTGNTITNGVSGGANVTTTIGGKPITCTTTCS